MKRLGPLSVMKFFKKSLLTILIVAVLLATPISSKKAYAFCCGCCTCWSSTVFVDLWGWVQNWIEINLHIFITLYFHRLLWFDTDFWQQNLLPAIAMMGEQLSAVGMQQMQIVGSFLDAKEQLEAQRDLQRMQARAHKDYHPAIEMCEFGTRIKSLATSQRRGEIASLAMSQRSLDRMLGNKSSVAPYGNTHDVRNRLKQFREKFCDRQDNNGGLSNVCTGPAPGVVTSAQMERYNKDVDFVRTFANPLTLNVDLTNAAVTDTEEEVLALGANLYGFFTFPGLDPKKLANDPGKKISLAQQSYLDLRSYVAKQSVAENSFNALVSMKSEGTPGSRAFLVAFLEEIGIPAAEINRYVGNNPSYYSQMEILTKLAYQTPSFYTNLYDKPLNVERKGVAIQAIGLMQKFDLLKSYIRTESSLSVLLEITIEDLQNEIEDVIKTINVSVEKG